MSSYGVYPFTTGENVVVTSGNVTGAQGTPNVTANAWPIQVTDTSSAASIFPAGFLRVSDEPTQQFYDPFDGTTFDSTTRWNAPTAAGGGVAAAQTAGSLTIGSGTTGSGYSYITSQPTFTPTIPSWLGNSWANQFEASPTLNAVRFWGMGTVPGVPTTATPITNGYGWEIGTDGKLRAVVYINGARTVVADLSSSGTNKQPLDGNLHRYIVYYRTDRIFWYLDSLAASGLVASASFISPAQQTLSLAVVAVAGATPPASNAVFTSAGLAVWDTGKNNQTISDGQYPFRRVTIKQASIGASGADTALVTTAVPNSITTYSASILSLATSLTATDIFTLTGSATKTVRVTRVRFSGTQTAAALQSLSLIKRSTANTGGTSTAQTAVPMDRNNSAATATVLAYTVNPATLGTTVGTIRNDKVYVQTTGAVPTVTDATFGTRNAQAVILRGTGDVLALNCNGSTGAGATFTIDIEWTEE